MPGVVPRPVGYTHYSSDELRLLSKWTDQGRPVAEIARLLGRDLSSVARRVRRVTQGGVPAQVGRPRALTPAQIDRLAVLANEMIEDADCKYQVTAGMLKAAMRLKCSEKTILTALHDRGVWFRPFREKPLLTDEDVEARMKFATAHVRKPVSFWTRTIDAYLDEKFFTAYLTPAARTYARKVRARGAFRGKKGGLAKGFVKPKKSLKQNFGRKVCVAVAISAKKVLTCYVPRKSWCGAAAQEFYAEHLGPALQKAHPSKRKFMLVEDNDPAGHKSGLGNKAKRAARISCLPYPKHSPELMPLDFGFWSSVNKRLRKQEASFDDGFTETRRHFVARLRRTILRTSPTFLTNLIADMPDRCARLKKAKGWHIEEGS